MLQVHRKAVERATVALTQAEKQLERARKEAEKAGKDRRARLTEKAAAKRRGTLAIASQDDGKEVVESDTILTYFGVEIVYKYRSTC